MQLLFDDVRRRRQTDPDLIRMAEKTERERRERRQRVDDV